MNVVLPAGPLMYQGCSSGNKSRIWTRLLINASQVVLNGVTAVLLHAGTLGGH